MGLFRNGTNDWTNVAQCAIQQTANDFPSLMILHKPIFIGAMYKWVSDKQRSESKRFNVCDAVYTRRGSHQTIVAGRPAEVLQGFHNCVCRICFMPLCDQHCDDLSADSAPSMKPTRTSSVLRIASVQFILLSGVSGSLLAHTIGYLRRLPSNNADNKMRDPAEKVTQRFSLDRVVSMAAIPKKIVHVIDSICPAAEDIARTTSCPLYALLVVVLFTLLFTTHVNHGECSWLQTFGRLILSEPRA
ncbi:unnamed protein product [Soboliphyme baturini]|uniref:Transmembrane protein n=1 Tax=Soboliphyme baturini TaxID=241478 RepID=A0A183IID6_9BILA|nr:unnamed protein product [Soboliphyme baturini]